MMCKQWPPDINDMEGCHYFENTASALFIWMSYYGNWGISVFFWCYLVMFFLLLNSQYISQKSMLSHSPCLENELGAKSHTSFPASLSNHVEFSMLFSHCISEIEEIEFFTPLELRGDCQPEDALPCVVIVKPYHEGMWLCICYWLRSQ